VVGVISTFRDKADIQNFGLDYAIYARSRIMRGSSFNSSTLKPANFFYMYRRSFNF
jgi:hypothetical protein